MQLIHGYPWVLRSSSISSVEISVGMYFTSTFIDLSSVQLAAWCSILDLVWKLMRNLWLDKEKPLQSEDLKWNEKLGVRNMNHTFNLIYYVYLNIFL